MNKPKATENELFNVFWQKYPRKEGKPQALRTFGKYCKDQETLEKVMKELERHSKQKDWVHINSKYIPLAQTWLNRRDWEENGNSESDTEKAEHRYGSWI